MNPENKTNIGSSTEEPFEEAPPAPEGAPMPQCPEEKCPEPEPEEAVLVEQGEKSETVETQQCPDCNLLQAGEEPVPEMDAYCACAKPGEEHGIPIAPDQVLAQYNSRPPVVIEKRPVRPVPAAPIQIKPKPGCSCGAGRIQIRPSHSLPVPVAPRPVNTCCRRPAYAVPTLNPARSGHAAPKR